LAVLFCCTLLVCARLVFDSAPAETFPLMALVVGILLADQKKQ